MHKYIHVSLPNKDVYLSLTSPSLMIKCNSKKCLHRKIILKVLSHLPIYIYMCDIKSSGPSVSKLKGARNSQLLIIGQFAEGYIPEFKKYRIPPYNGHLDVLMECK